MVIWLGISGIEKVQLLEPITLHGSGTDHVQLEGSILLRTQLHVRFLLQRPPTNPTSVIVICRHRGSEQGYRNFRNICTQTLLLFTMFF